MAIILSILNGF